MSLLRCTGVFVSGVAIGSLASLLGLGGGVFLVPLFSLAGWAGTFQVAAGSSIVAVATTGIFSSFTYARARSIDYRLGLLLAPSTALFAWIGAKVSSAADPSLLALVFGLFLLYPAAAMSYRSRKRDAGSLNRGDPYHLRSMLIAICGGAIAGFLAGLLGIGGGPLLVPLLILALGRDVTTSAATALFTMIPSATAAAIQHGLQGNIALDLAVPAALGAVVGAQIGPRLGTRLPKQCIRRGFAVILVLVATQMIWGALR